MVKTPLQEWISAQIVDDDLLWKGAWGRQVEFVRDELAGLVGAGLDYEDRKAMGIASVISTHRSKSVVLPVYELARPDLGLRLILRGNFYNWKLSVLSEYRTIQVDFSGLFHTTPPVEPEYTGDHLSPVYFEGFPRELIFGYLATSDGKRWSAEIGGTHGLWTAVFLLMRDLGAVQPARWRTRESHRRKLDAESAKWRDRMAREGRLGAIEAKLEAADAVDRGQERERREDLADRDNF